MTRELRSLCNFREWLEMSIVQEITRLAHLDTSKVELQPKRQPFDANYAREVCAERLDSHINYDDAGIYDYPHDDPDFGVEDVETWELENPEPRERDHDDEEDYKSAMEDWRSERESVDKRYIAAVERWEKKMQERREDAESEAMESCVEDQREIWENDEEEGYTYEFEYEGDDFRIDISKDQRYNLNGVRLNRPVTAFNIEFEGPDSYDLTGRSGAGAVVIYSKMLSAIKKLMEIEDVNAITFSSYHPFMIPMYDRFVKTYLGDTFTQVSKNMYLRSDKVKEIMSTMQPQDRSEAEKAMASAREEQSKLVEKIKLGKQAMRRVAQSKNQIIGKIVGMNKSGLIRPAVVVDVTPKSVELEVVGYDGKKPPELKTLRYSAANYDDFVSPDKIDKGMLEDFLREVRSGQTALAAKISKIPGYDGSFYNLQQQPN